VKTKRIIVDVGAAGFPNSPGQYGYRPGDIAYVFEPNKTAYDLIKENCSSDENIHVYNIALSNTTGKSNFYLTQKQDCSSLRCPNELILKDRDDITTYKEIEVDVDLLDNILGHLTHIDYLKLDTQGSEYEVLLGASELLKRTKHIKCEVESTEWYKGQKLAADVVELLKSKGFKQIHKQGRSKTHCDIIFINKNL
jgi:FkbM family methyltransferase